MTSSYASLFQFHDITGLLHIVKKIVVTERSGVVCCWHMFLFPSFIVCHPDSVKVLLKSSEPKPIGTGGVYSFLMEWIGNYFTCATVCFWFGWLVYGVLRHCHQYFSYFVVVSFIDGGNQDIWRKPPTCCRKLLTNFITQCCIEYITP